MYILILRAGIAYINRQRFYSVQRSALVGLTKGPEMFPRKSLLSTVPRKRLGATPQQQPYTSLPVMATIQSQYGVLLSNTLAVQTTCPGCLNRNGIIIMHDNSHIPSYSTLRSARARLSALPPSPLWWRRRTGSVQLYRVAADMALHRQFHLVAVAIQLGARGALLAAHLKQRGGLGCAPVQLGLEPFRKTAVPSSGLRLPPVVKRQEQQGHDDYDQPGAADGDARYGAAAQASAAGRPRTARRGLGRSGARAIRRSRRGGRLGRINRRSAGRGIGRRILVA